MQTRDLIDQFITQVEAKDLPATLALFHRDAIFEDPHYPRQCMAGIERISKGLRWGFNSIAQFHFEVTDFFPHSTDNKAIIETHCRHKLPTGKQLDFKQVLVFEFTDGLIKHLSMYTPFGPHGITGIIIFINRIITRALNKV